MLRQDQLKRRLPVLLPALSGLLLAASFPGAGQNWLAWLAWVAWVPLILSLWRVRTRARAFGAGLLAGGISTGILLQWIPAVLARYGGMPIAAAWGAYGLLVALLACYPGAVCLAVKHLMERGGRGWILLFPAAWVLGEYALSFSPLGGLPWLLAGYTQADFLPVIQIADIAGVYGVSALVLAVNTAIARALVSGGRPGRLAPLLGAAALLALSFLYGARALERWGGVAPRYQAAMLQGNLSADDPEEVLAEKFSHGYLEMARALPPGEIDLLILPESPAPKLFQYDDGYRRSMEALARAYPLGLVFSNIRYEASGEDERYFNSAFFLDRQGKVAGIYDKIHLVPFGEYIPGLFTFAQTISQDVGAFSPGDRYGVFDLGGNPAGAVICFEAVFPALVREFTRRGSGLILNLTNDAWYGNSAAPYQHLAISRFRAVENRRYLLRAANSGVTAGIEPTGRIQSATGILRQAVGRARFTFLSDQTFYTRYGDVFIFLCAIILLVSALWVERKKRIHLRRERCSRS